MPSEFPPSLRRSLLAPLGTGGRAGEVERRIEEAIELGALADGEQLPSESELAASLGVAPMTLREALVGLRRSGLVETRRGRGGGTFVCGSEDVQRARLLARLAARSVDQIYDTGVEHATLAAAAARLAAERALDGDVARLERHVADLARADGERAARAADARFHIELAAAAHSQRLTNALTRMQADVSGLTWMLLGPGRVASATREHRAVVEAVRAGDHEAAAERMHRHLADETGALMARRIEMYGPSPARGARVSRAAMTRALSVVEDALEAAFAFLVAARDDAVAELAAHGPPWDTTNLDRLGTTMQEALHAPEALMSGLGLALTQAAPVDGPHWIWWRAVAGRSAPLPVEQDRLHPEYYDYESAAWFATPFQSAKRAITGPFIDHGAADDHIFTLAVPLRGPARGSAPIGVVGADVSVARLEAVALPALRALGGQAVLLNGDGVVIASGAERHVSGDVWDRAHLERLGDLRERWVTDGDDRLLRSSKLGWALVTTPG